MGLFSHVGWYGVKSPVSGYSAWTGRASLCRGSSGCSASTQFTVSLCLPAYHFAAASRPAGVELLVSSHSECGGALGGRKAVLHLCKLGDEVHPCVSEEKMKGRLGVGRDQQPGRSTGGSPGPLLGVP